MLKRILTILGYLLAGALVIGGTIIIVAIARGYSYDFKANRFIVNGLVIFDSQPSGASIFVNDKQSRHKTPYRTTLESGVYSFEITKSGYRNWQKDLEIVASQVTWAQYVVLFPQDIKARRLYASQNIGQIISTPDRKQFAYIQAGTTPTVWRFRVGDKTAVKVYEAKPAEAGLSAEALTGLAWSNDGERLLIASSRGDKTHHNVAVVDSGTIFNLSETFGFQFGDIRFSPTNSNQLYWLSPEGLRRIDLGSRTVSAVLAEQVTAFGFGGGRVFYVQNTELGKTLWELDSSDRRHRLIESLAESESYQIAYATYQRQPMLAVIPASTHTLTLYTNLGENLNSKVITRQAGNMSFNNDGRFLAYWTPESIGTYDLEKSRRTNFRKNLSDINHISWFDNYHLLVSHGNVASVVEFDGANLTNLTSIQAGGAALATSDQNELIFIKEPLTGQPPRLYQAKLK